MAGGKSGWIVLGAFLIALSPPALGQAPYVPDVTEAREKEWRKLVAASQAAYASEKPVEGLQPARDALALADELFGADDPRTLISANDLALQLDAAGHFEEAEVLYRRVVESYRRTRGEDDPNTQLAIENLVDFYVANRRYDAAWPLADYALRSFRRTTGSASARSQRMERILGAIPPPPSPDVPPASPAAAGPSPLEAPASAPDGHDGSAGPDDDQGAMEVVERAVPVTDAPGVVPEAEDAEQIQSKLEGSSSDAENLPGRSADVEEKESMDAPSSRPSLP